jgi:hypothetical protein
VVRVGGESGSEADHPAAADQLINAEVAEKVLAEVAGRGEFDNNFILDEKIQPISKINANAIVAHGQRKLRFDTQPP